MKRDYPLRKGSYDGKLSEDIVEFVRKYNFAYNDDSPRAKQPAAEEPKSPVGVTDKLDVVPVQPTPAVPRPRAASETQRPFRDVSPAPQPMMAAAPSQPEKSNKLILIIAGIVIAAGIGTAVALLLHNDDSSSGSKKSKSDSKDSGAAIVADDSDEAPAVIEEPDEQQPSLPETEPVTDSAPDEEESSEEESSEEESSEEESSEEDPESEEEPESSEDSDPGVVEVRDPDSASEDDQQPDENAEVEYDMIYKMGDLDPATKQRRYDLINSTVSTSYNVLYSGADGDLSALYTDQGSKLCELDKEHDYYKFYSNILNRELIVVIQDEPTGVGDGNPDNGFGLLSGGEGNG